jgi:hypothetical protein
LAVGERRGQRFLEIHMQAAIECSASQGGVCGGWDGNDDRVEVGPRQERVRFGGGAHSDPLRLEATIRIEIGDAGERDAWYSRQELQVNVATHTPAADESDPYHVDDPSIASARDVSGVVDLLRSTLARV